jgi:hypothetical protein
MNDGAHIPKSASATSQYVTKLNFMYEYYVQLYVLTCKWFYIHTSDIFSPEYTVRSENWVCAFSEKLIPFLKK